MPAIRQSESKETRPSRRKLVLPAPKNVAQDPPHNPDHGTTYVRESISDLKSGPTGLAVVANAETRRDADDSVHQAVRRRCELLAVEMVQILQSHPPIGSDISVRYPTSAAAIIRQRPENVMALAYEKLNSFVFSDVPRSWLCLYEDACLWRAAQLLNMYGTFDPIVEVTDPDDVSHRSLSGPEEWLRELVAVLDKGRSTSSSSRWDELYDQIFDRISALAAQEPFVTPKLPENFDVKSFTLSNSPNSIPKLGRPPTFEQFQCHLNNKTTPLVIQDAITHWPALQRWADPSYLPRLTIAGRRCVPVEIGRSYTSPDYQQQVIPLIDFLQTYILSTSPPATGYLAQHDLLSTIPALAHDYQIPEYCYTTPPAPDAHAAQTKGLAAAPRLHTPLLHTWFGPSRTRTPLHTDPYHNLLAQVVGYKYVRLYAPAERSRLPLLGVDARGVDQGNTAAADVALLRRRVEGEDEGEFATEWEGNETARRELRENFPLFETAAYCETVLGPGECLFVPLGWWHYVESLSTSISVSFWWN